MESPHKWWYTPATKEHTCGKCGKDYREWRDEPAKARKKRKAREEFEMLEWHCGHKIECVRYADKDGIVYNVALECVECNEVLFSLDYPE